MPCFVEHDSSGMSEGEVAARMGWSTHGCFGSWDDSIRQSYPPRSVDCLKPGEDARQDSSTGRVVFLVGDSHAGALFPAFEKAVQGKMSLLFSAAPGWSFRSACDKRFAELEQNVQAGDVVVVASIEYAVRSVDGHQPFWTTEMAFWRNALIPMLTARGAKLVFVGDTYAIRTTSRMCATPRRAAHFCSYSESELGFGWGYRLAHPGSITKRELLSRVKDFARAYEGTFHIFDQTLDLFMVNGHGSNLVPGTSTNAYYDEDHLNTDGALYLAPYICAAFDEWGFFTPRPADFPFAASSWRAGTAVGPDEGPDEWCERVHTQYCVRPGAGLGLLPEEARETHSRLRCEHLECCGTDMGCTGNPC